MNKCDLFFNRDGFNSQKDFYVLQLIVRGKDLDDNDQLKDLLIDKKEALLNTTIVNSIDKLVKIYPRYKKLAELTKGRLYLTVNSYSLNKVVKDCIVNELDILTNNDVNNINRFSKLYKSCVRRDSHRSYKNYFMLDFDKELDKEIIRNFAYCVQTEQIVICKSTNNYHIISKYNERNYKFVQVFIEKHQLDDTGSSILLNESFFMPLTSLNYVNGYQLMPKNILIDYNVLNELQFSKK